MKKTILFFVVLGIFTLSGLFILYKVFKDVDGWGGDAETVQKTEENDSVKKEENNNLSEDAVKEMETATTTQTENKVVQNLQNNNTSKTEPKTETKKEPEPKKELKPVVVASDVSCAEGQSLKCWDNLSCYNYGGGYGSPALWTAAELNELPPVCGQWKVDSAKLPTSWSCCCGSNIDWSTGGDKSCYSPVYTAELIYN